MMRFFLVAMIFGASFRAFAVEPDAPTSLISKGEALGIMVQNTLQAKMKVKVAHRRVYESLLEFYAERSGAPVWVENGAFSPKVRGVRAAIANAEMFGLSPSDYAPPSDDMLKKTAVYPDEVVASAEADMSFAAVLYANHARSGRFNPQEVDENFDPSPDVPSASSVLKAIMKEEADITALLESHHPQHPQFKALLREYNAVGLGKSRASSLPTSGPNLREGMSHPDVALVRGRLKVPASDGASDATFDQALSARVKSFQKDNGLRPDGIVSGYVRQLLQPSPSPSRKMILANMERWRWMPRELGTAYVKINLPEYLVRIVRNDRIDFEERIVIGTVSNQTPIFSNKMRTVVVNPYWNVPASIAEKEIIPLVQRNPGYLARNGMEALVNGYGGKAVQASMIDWGSVDAQDIMIRQLPGGGNALGELKFLFPNRHNVYLHDTPSKHLFNEKARPFSHGCMRVRNPRTFAQAVLGWSKEQVDQAIKKGGDNQEVPVDPRLPVHVMYFTVWAGDDGEFQTFRDVYGHDQKVIEALADPVASYERARYIKLDKASREG